MRKILIINLIVLVLSGCEVNIIGHNEKRAVSDANKVLKILYLKEDYKSAYDMFDPEFQKHYEPDNLKQVLNEMKNKFGKLKELQVDSFLPMPGQKAITLFYNGINEKGISHHRVILVGDAKGYKVTGVFLANQPYPEHKLRQKFDRNIVVK